MSIQIVRIERGRKIADGPVLAMETLDGVPLGVARVLETAAGQARQLGAPLAVLQLEPDPRRALESQAAAFALASRDQELRALDRLGVERLYVLAFDQSLAAMTHEDFAREILRDTLGVRHVVATPQVSYGHRCLGGRQQLLDAGVRFGFGVTLVQPSGGEGAHPGDQIRALLEQGQVNRVAALFGRPFAIEGVVQHGAALGRTIGFPTANVSLADYARPAAGTYASISRLADGRILPSLSYIGRRPTIDDGDPCLEVHIFDFSEDLYGQVIETALIEYLRPDERFESLDAMREQMVVDLRQGYMHAQAMRSKTLFDFPVG